MNLQRHGRAFTLTESAVALAAAAVLASIAMTTAAESRRQSSLDQALARLESYGEATGLFAADNEDRLWGFSWKGGTVELMADVNGKLVPTELPDDDTGAAAYQAVHLIRTLGDRVGADGIPIINGWMANVSYSHLPLMEYLGVDPLDDMTSDPADRLRLAWKMDPINNFDEGVWLPYQPQPTASNKRWPYSSSYRVVPASWDFMQSDLRNGEGLRISQGGDENIYVVPFGHQFGGRSLSDVAFTSQKVHMHDKTQRHFGSCRPHFATSDAIMPLLMFDGAAQVRASADANLGWRPNTPTQPCHLYFADPEAQSGACPNDSQIVRALYDWTRGGLLGIDFDGDPLDTGQRGECPN